MFIRGFDLCCIDETTFSNKDSLISIINDFLAYEMIFGWSTHEKLAYPYCKEKNKAFTVINNGKTSFFLESLEILSIDHKYRKNINDLFVGRVEKYVALLHLSGEQLYTMVLEYNDIVFGFKFDKQKLSGFGLTYNWVK